jgi:hypothetical protein
MARWCMWEPHLVVRGCCVLARLCGACLWAGIWWCRGCVPPMCGCPSVWLVCLRPSTSRVFGPLASSSPSLASDLSLSLTHTPAYPIPCYPRGSVVPVVGPPQHCRSAVPPQPTPTHPPLLPQGCHAPDVLSVSLLVCVCAQRYCFLFPFCCVSTLVCCPYHLPTPLWGSAVYIQPTPATPPPHRAMWILRDNARMGMPWGVLWWLCSSTHCTSSSSSTHVHDAHPICTPVHMVPPCAHLLFPTPHNLSTVRCAFDGRALVCVSKVMECALWSAKVWRPLLAGCPAQKVLRGN